MGKGGSESCARVALTLDLAVAPAGGTATGHLDEREIERELRAFIGDRSTWPTTDEFAQSGQSELYERLKATGGAASWRQRLSLRQAGGPKSAYTDERIERELRALVQATGSWPAHSDFKRAGLVPLYALLQRHPLKPQGWADRLGVTHIDHRRRGWNAERVERELREFVAGRSTWPTQAEFRAAGQARLLYALYAFGGHREWAERFGLPMLPSGGQPQR